MGPTALPHSQDCYLFEISVRPFLCLGLKCKSYTPRDVPCVNLIQVQQARIWMGELSSSILISTTYPNPICILLQRGSIEMEEPLGKVCQFPQRLSWYSILTRDQGNTSIRKKTSLEMPFSKKEDRLELIRRELFGYYQHRDGIKPDTLRYYRMFLWLFSRMVGSLGKHLFHIS